LIDITATDSMLARLLVYIAYFLKNSERYQRTKHFFYDLLENPKSKIKTRFDLFMILLVMSSVFSLVYQVEHELGQWGIWLEYFVVTVFIIEYLLRLWVYSDSHRLIIDYYEHCEYLSIHFSVTRAIKKVVWRKLEYIFTPAAIIDLLAILPSYRSVRILRIFLIFRLFKLLRYSQNMKMFADVIRSKRFELLTLMVFLGFLVFIASIAIYLFENPTSGGQVGHLYDAVYWAIVTISTVGYGDITPMTTGGRLVTMILILTSLGVLAFFTSIIVAAFNEQIDGLRTNRVFSELERLPDLIIIGGFGRVGQQIAQLLADDQQYFVIIDQSEARVEEAKQAGYFALQADATDNDILAKAGINKNVSTVICATGNDVINVYITLTCRHLSQRVQIISRANRHENLNKLYQAGADTVIEPFIISGLLAAEYIGQPVAFEAISGILNEQKNILLEAIKVKPGSILDNQYIGEIDFAAKKLTLVGVISHNPMHLKHKNKYPIKHQHFYFNPSVTFKLQADDIVVVLGRDVSISYFRDQVEQSHLLG
jgi:voltage-gated potassium channel